MFADILNITPLTGSCISPLFLAKKKSLKSQFISKIYCKKTAHGFILMCFAIWLCRTDGNNQTGCYNRPIYLGEHQNQEVQLLLLMLFLIVDQKALLIIGKLFLWIREERLNQLRRIV